MTKSRDLGNVAQTVAVNLPTSLGTAGQTLVVNSGADGLEFGAASGGSMTVYNDLNGTDGTPSGYTYLTNASSPSNGDLAFVTANNTVYVRAASGWRKIATVQEAPSTITGHSASYPDIGQNATTDITLSTTDPEGFDVTWSYVVGGNGTLSGSNINNSNGDTLASIAVQTANANSGGTNTITFRVTRQTTSIAGDFTITFTATDSQSTGTSDTGAISFEIAFFITHSHFTSLLMATDGSAGANSTVTDTPASGNTAKTPSVVGDIYAGTFSPYRHGGYSTYFDGTGDSLAISGGSDFSMAGDFTAEAWIYATATTNDYAGIFGFSHDSQNTGWNLLLRSNGKFHFNVGMTFSDATGSVDLNTWTHVALVRSGSGAGNCKLYINGVADATTLTKTGTVNQPTFIEIGGYPAISSRKFTGYISDIRVVNGTAVYTSNFTPPTERLTAVTNTKLLTCHLPYIADTPPSGGTAKTIIVNGNTSTKPFGPYDYDEYDESINGGSLYFDGSDYLSLGTDSDFLIGNNDYSIEAWVYFTSASFPQGWVNHQNSTSTASAGQFLAYFYTNNSIRIADHTANRPAVVCTLPETLVANTWYHVSINRYDSNTSFKVYLNGVEATNYTTSNGDGRFTNFSAQGTVAVGVIATPIWFTGYMADFRWLVGSSAYTTDGTPPTAPLSAITNTKLLLKGTDAHVLDKSQVSNLKLFGGAAASTTQAKFSNTASVYFDGTGDYVEGPSVSDLNIGTGDFTVECWVYETTLNTDRGIWEARSKGNATDGMTFTRINTDAFRVWSGGALITTGSVTIQNTWVHCAVVRYNGTLTIYINGSSSGTPVSNSTNFSSSEPFVVGGGRHNTTATPTAFMTGYVQDLRVSNYARYTSNFTVPSAPLKG